MPGNRGVRASCHSNERAGTPLARRAAMPGLTGSALCARCHQIMSEEDRQARLRRERYVASTPVGVGELARGVGRLAMNNIICIVGLIVILLIVLGW